MLGTFLVRSGVLTSVHAFANDPSRGVFILCLLVFISGAGGILLYKNLHKYSDQNNIHLLSREGAISLNNIFMLTITGTVLLGTIYPLFTDAFFEKKISVGAPFFNATISPLVIPMVLGMILGPLMKWGRDDLKQIFFRLKPIIFINFLLMLLVWYLAYRGPVIAIIFIALAIWLATSSLFEIYQLVLINLKKKNICYTIKNSFTSFSTFWYSNFNNWSNRYFYSKKRKYPVSRSRRSY